MTSDIRDAMVAEQEDPALARAAQALLLHEARVLDARRYDDWLTLWHPSEPLCYWVPCNEDDYDPTEHVSLVFDDRLRLQERVARLLSPAAHAQDPPSRTVRAVTNFEIDSSSGDLATVHSVQVLGEFRNGDQTCYYARMTHMLRRDGNGLRIQEKKVVLVNNDGYFRNLTFLL